MMNPYPQSVAPAQGMRHHCPPHSWLRPPAMIRRLLEDMAVVSALLPDWSRCPLEGMAVVSAPPSGLPPMLSSDVEHMCSDWCIASSRVVDCKVGKTTLRILRLCKLGSSNESYKAVYCTRRNPELD